MRKPRNSLSQQAIYQEMLKIAGDAVPTNGVRHYRTTSERAQSTIPDRVKMDAVLNICNLHQRGLVTSKNAVAIVLDIVR
jgi:hypothetical protein